MEVKDRETQGCNREVASEGSVEQRCEPMNKNRMRRKRWTSWLVTAKSISIKNVKRILGGCAPKVVELLGRSAVCRRRATEESGSDPERAAEVSSEHSTLSRNRGRLKRIGR